MSNIVEFVVRMRDLMSGNLNRLSSTSQSAFSRMAQHSANLTSRNRVLGQSYNELQRRIRDVENTTRNSTIPNQISAARRELAALQRQASSHPGRPSSGGGSGGSGGSVGGGGFSIGGMAIGSMLGGIGMNIASAFLGAVKDGIGAAIAGSMQKEKDIVGLSTFLGKDGANQTYKNVRKDAETSSYDTATLLKANRALISVDGNAAAAREDVMNLANAISATGGGTDELQRMAINMQQIKSLGVASAADIKQFGYAGINIYGLLSKATGKSATEVKKMDVTYDLLAKSLAMARMEGGLYEGALEAMNKTMSGKWESVKDRASNALTDIGDAFAPVIMKVLDIFIRMSESVAPILSLMQPYIEMISTGIGKAIDYVMNLSAETGTWSDYLVIGSEWIGTIWELLKKAGVVVGTILGGIIQWVHKSEIIKDIFRLIGGLLKAAGDIIGWIGDGLLWVWENALKPLLDGLETAYKWIKEMIGGDDTLTIEVKKTNNQVKQLKGPEAPKADASYFSDLTRFKDAGVPASEEKKEKNKKKSKEAGDTIAGGGTKYITINLGKFFDNIQFTTMNMKESEQDIEKILMELMGRVLYNGAKNA
ncbi:MAG: tape measure protein [Chryseobacterium sp.]